MILKMIFTHNNLLMILEYRMILSDLNTGEADQLPKAMEVLLEMKEMGLFPNTITYSMLLVASERYVHTGVLLV